VKLHDLRPAAGSRQERVRVGRGIAAGKGKTAGRGTKGQKARAGGSIPAHFEGGQTPLQMRVPKLHGFKNRFRIEYEIVNVGRLGEAVEAGRLGEPASAAGAPVMVNTELLRATGLVGTLRRPVKVLGHGELNQKLFVLADAFTKSARAKIEAAGGTAQVIEIPDAAIPAVDAAEVVEDKPKPARSAARKTAKAVTTDAPATTEATEAAPPAE
jgi:large subunit ribosomal protein L15